MRTPIGWALAYPRRPELPMVRRLDLFSTQISFDAPDLETFRCLELAVEAGKKAAIVECGGEAGSGDRAPSRRAAGQKGLAAVCPVRTVAAPIVLNAANEVAVEAFLEGRLPFLGIPEIVEKCLTWLGDEPVESVEDVYACDDEARRFAREATGRAS
jgi:1-deoxy-D-xylulose-5-phosphate reductoisomerase